MNKTANNNTTIMTFQQQSQLDITKANCLFQIITPYSKGLTQAEIAQRGK
ncbi:MAG TPA: hypothetical protein VLA74_12770 [Nitrososphaeraceae archaeon]|nr:hypothetical protein [Nitrososphaeraceae archaeon]